MEIIQDDWTPLLEKLKAEIAEPTVMLQQIGQVIEQTAKENIGGMDGTDRPEWKQELSPGHIRKLKRMGINRDYATLEIAGDLKNSIKAQEPDGKSITITASDYKASFHQLGEGKNPIRTFFPVTPEGDLTERTQREISEVIEARLDRIS